MANSATRRFILPFSTQTRSELEVEAAAVFAVAEFERGKGGGLITRQPEERIAYISRVGYPLWLFPKNDAVFIFDGLNDSIYNVPYFEVPSAKVFLEILAARSRPRENYAAFLKNHDNYFTKPMAQRQFAFRGLIADAELKSDFAVYRREATEATGSANFGLLLPILEEPTIASMLSEFDMLLSAFKEDTQKLSECARLISKTTLQYMTELDYEVQAVKEEADAKIRAQEELVTPQVASLTKNYKGKIKDVTDRFDRELESLEKLKAKTEKFIEDSAEKIKLYEREAKAQGKKGHAIYEERWKDKVKRTQKEVNGLKKQLKNIEKNHKNRNRQKAMEISRLYSELAAEVKFARQPVVALEVDRDKSMEAFKRETEKLLVLQKPVVEGLNRNLKLREALNADFERLTFKDVQVKSPSLFYVSCYVVCYAVGFSRRYLMLPPSTVGDVDFSAKLKGAFGMSKSRNLLSPRFKSITALVSKAQVLAEQNSVFANQLDTLGERNNLLRNSQFLQSVKAGLVYLKHDGWLSEREHKDLAWRVAV